MKKILATVIVALLSAASASAQWRAGLTMGAVSNSLDLDRQYQYDWRYKHRWGMDIGAVGQYDVKDWFGIRAELHWMQRGYSQHRTHYSAGTEYRYRNNYLVLPVMGSFSFGGSKLRGFLNAGIYGGYWLTSNVEGAYVSKINGREDYGIDQDTGFNSTRDQRWDFGYVGGIGIEYKVCPNIAAQLECRYYYSVTSTTKQYMRVKDYRYNNTLGIQATVMYLF